MADVLFDTESAPNAPAVNQLVVFPETKTTVSGAIDRLAVKETGGKVLTMPPIINASAAAQAYTTSEIYLTGSALAIPAHGLQIGSIMRWHVVATKTAGTAIPVFIVKIGTLGTTGDAAIATFTGFAGPTSATDTAWVDIELIIRTIGTSATSEGGIKMIHALQTTGWSNVQTAVQRVDGTTFNSTTANLIAGVTFNHSTAGAGNIEMVDAEMVGV